MQMKILLTAAVLFLLGSDACMRNKAVVRLKCPENRYKTASSRITSARVSWDRKDFSVESTRPIRGIYQTAPIYGELVSVDRQFYEGTHYIEYKAVDDGGNVDSCSFRVTVTVIRCAQIQNPLHYGMVECDSGNLYGSTCIISCIPGYSIVGRDSITCKQNGQWSDDIPFCRTTTCPDPGTPLHGTRMCTTATHAYGSICSFHCDHGFQLVGNDRIICRADSGATSWSGITPICKEITPPRSEVCPGNLQLTTSTAITEIQKPKVVFRTGDGTEAPHTCDLFGDKPSYNFTIGTHTITCRAFDPVFGNQAVTVCKFTIKIKPNPCRPLAQPLNGFLLCSLAEGSASSMHETSCRLFCNNGYAFPREDGPTTHIFECDHTGTWQPSDIVPSCVTPRRPKEVRLPSEIYYTSNNCTQLDALNMVRVSFQSVLQATIRMQHACAINPGDCIVADVEVRCKVDGEEDRSRRYISSSETDTVPVGSTAYRHSSSGGPSPGRQRRASHNNNNKRRRDETGVQPRSSSSSTGFTLPIQFHFGTRVSEKGRWPIEYHRASARLYGMFDYFERHVLDGTFTIKSRVTSLQVEEVKDSLTYAPVKARCDIGYKFNDEILLCVPCGAGTHYNVEEGLCEPCSVGMYQDEEAQFHCKQCPPGTASIEPGAMNLTQCLEIDDCVSTPCKNNGRCLDGRSSFTCDCSFGYSGRTCEERVYDCSVHSCQFGGSCIPEGRHNYTCSCAPGHYGDYCQIKIINGGWGEWSEWTPCTASCDGGTTSRNRTCDSPEPSEQGENCQGGGMEMKVCNDHQCPVCKRLRRPYQGSMKCTKDEDGELVSCTISCPKGYWFSGPVFHEYTCGKNTSYLWPHQSPDNPRCILPACTKMQLTEDAKYEFKTKFPMECMSEEVMVEVRHQVKKRAAEMTKDLACLREGTCSLDEPQIRGCEKPDNSGRKKRSTGDDKREVDIKVSITYHGKFASLSTPEKKALDSTESELQNLRKNLLHEAETGELVLVIDGESIRADPNSTRTSNHLDCPPGMTQDQDAICCVECSPGTFYDEEESTCILCELGSYQPLPAQSVCLPCPNNMTTYGRGAVHQPECYENGTEPPNIPFDDEFQDTRNDVPLHIIVPVVVSFLLLVGLALIVLYRCKNRRKIEKYNVVHKQDNEREKKPEEISLYQREENA